MFYICRSCYRGQVYCRDECRLRGVTDHTSAGCARSGNIKKPLKETGMSMPFKEGFQDRARFERHQAPLRPVCILCGRVGGCVDVKKIDPEKEKP